MHKRTARRTNPAARGGFSLMEVILSIAILGAATGLVGELTHYGIRNARYARDLTQAELLCESKLNEIVAGIAPLENVSDDNFDNVYDPDQLWRYSVEWTEADTLTGLLLIKVSVRHDLPQSQRPAQFSLTRWLMPPAAPSETESSTASGSNSSSTTSGGTSTGAANGTGSR